MSPEDEIRRARMAGGARYTDAMIDVLLGEIDRLRAQVVLVMTEAAVAQMECERLRARLRAFTDVTRQEG